MQKREYTINFDNATERVSSNGTPVLQVKGIAPLTDVMQIGVVLAVPAKMVGHYKFKLICEPVYEVL